MRLNRLAKEIYKANQEKGFWEHRNGVPKKMKESGMFSKEEIEATQKAFTGQAIALIHSEVSEALEADRKNLKDDKLPERDGLPVELVDTLIRILDLMGSRGDDVDAITREKLEYNKSRPHKHGKKY